MKAEKMCPRHGGRGQGFAARPSHRLGVGHADQERSDQAGALGDRDPVDLPKGAPPLAQGLAHHVTDVAQVLPAGQFGDHPAEGAMGRNLRCDHVGEHLAPVAHQGGGGLVAGGFDSQYQHKPLSPAPRPDRRDYIIAAKPPDKRESKAAPLYSCNPGRLR